MLLWSLGCMCLFNNDIMNIGCIFLKYTSRSEIPRWYGRSAFSFLKNLHTVIHPNGTNLHSRKQCMRVPFSHKLTNMLFVDISMIAILTDLWWYLIVILICISLMISNVEHLFICWSSVYLLLKNVHSGFPFLIG